MSASTTPLQISPLQINPREGAPSASPTPDPAAPPVTLEIDGQIITPFPDETVLDALLRVGIDTPFSCRGGACQTCLTKCTEGEIPRGAQRRLSDRIKDLGYFLPCKCVASGPMKLARKDPADMTTACMLVAVEGHSSGSLRITFETMTALDYRSGQSLRLVTGVPPDQEPVLMLTSDPATSPCPEARLVLTDGTPLPACFAQDAEPGGEFEIRGPFSLDYRDLPEITSAPPLDPALWQALDQGGRLRSIFDTFYAKVFADTQLAPFFEGVTQDRAASKQYSFLQQMMTGEKVYWGEKPRNAHHWMVITHALFDHRQALMVETLREYGLSQDQISRWTRFEEYFRADIVKDREWPKKIGGEYVETGGFAHETMTDPTLCDRCGGEVLAGETVLYHRRTGRISCNSCAGG
ncbi:2Fe-2S iron-sulfur cluster binding domain-containing protein [Xinfangfangia sp. D13-10-4-6]|uniref:2Fe-2S iron-sulfur cluster-binding protein n=1 Tax=Pseudogemmobacter hezensis TaxID=2737662 RepID=UPI001554A835|nr:2Fe-2S iron-sulfur cluster-binding protein [Pseudogemmobacter hezensis]NPD16032.1 2Fe-2S iron-sulfur cluster binding domain-containing protein [Pseudogemmobacter hezensis]